MIYIPPADVRQHSEEELGGTCNSILNVMMRLLSRFSLYVIFLLVGLGFLLWTLSGIAHFSFFIHHPSLLHSNVSVL